jgi:hypothetical protein
MEKITVARKIAKTLNQSSSNNYITIFQKSVFSKAGYRLIEEFNELSNITIVNYIHNIPGVEYPVIPLEYSDSERDKVLLDLQWKSPRIHLAFYLDVDGEPRTQLEVQSLLSPKPYPYAKISINDIPLGNNGKLLASIINVGWGLLQNNDKVVILADCTSTYYVDKISNGRIVQNTITSSPSQLLPENANRTAFTITNNTDSVIYLDISNSVSIINYMIPIQPNTYYESMSSFATSAIYAITDSPDISVQLREFL